MFDVIVVGLGVVSLIVFERWKAWRRQNGWRRSRFR